MVGRVSGWAAIYREIGDHPLFKQDMSRLGAWVWLVINAAWKPTPFDVNGKMITINRGQLSCSMRHLASEWGWSKSAVERFLTRLKTETMIETQTGTGRILITICNYEKYQDVNGMAGTASGTASGTGAGQERDIKEQVNQITIEEEESPNGDSRQTEGKKTFRNDHCGQASAEWNLAASQTKWPAISKLTDVRAKHLSARLDEHGLTGWKDALLRAEQSPMLSAQPPPGWFTFDWLCKPGNFLKLIEGNYDRRYDQLSNQPTSNRGEQIHSGWIKAAAARSSLSQTGSPESLGGFFDPPGFDR
jgi:hypothetical protein